MGSGDCRLAGFSRAGANSAVLRELSLRRVVPRRLSESPATAGRVRPARRVLPVRCGKASAFVPQPRRKLATIPEGRERLHHRVRCARAWGAQRLSNSKLPALDPALALVILRVTLGALVLSTFSETLGRRL